MTKNLLMSAKQQNSTLPNMVSNNDAIVSFSGVINCILPHHSYITLMPLAFDQKICKSRCNAEAYSDPCQTSRIEFFVKV